MRSPAHLTFPIPDRTMTGESPGKILVRAELIKGK